jgi:hypothetical protein
MIRRAVCGVTSSVFAKIPSDTDGFAITSSTNSGTLRRSAAPPTSVQKLVRQLQSVMLFV